MSIYLIDYENVNLSGLRGIETLTEMDRVYVFYGANAGYIPFEKHIMIAKARAEVTYLRVDRSGKNYLDFQLATYSGYLVAMYSEREYVIVSRDTGFDSIVNFWNMDPEQRGVHFSRREAILPPPPVRTREPAAAIPQVVREVFVPAQASTPPVENTEKPIASETSVGSGRSRRRGRGRGRGGRSVTPAVVSEGVFEADVQAEALMNEALPAVPEQIPVRVGTQARAEMESKPLPSSEAHNEPEALPIEDVRAEEAHTEKPHVEESGAEESPAEEPRAEEAHAEEAHQEEERLDEKPEKDAVISSEPEKTPWGKLPNAVAYSKHIGVYIPGAAASGKGGKSTDQAQKEDERTVAEVMNESLDALLPIPRENELLDVREEPLSATNEAQTSREEKTKRRTGRRQGQKKVVQKEDKAATVSSLASEEKKTDETKTEEDRNEAKSSEPKPAPKSKPNQNKKAEKADRTQPSSTETDEKKSDAAENAAPPRLSERFRARIREALKDEALGSGAYTQIYNRIMKCDTKSRLNNELSKAFTQEKGVRIYKLILPVYEEYRKSISTT